MAHWSSSPTSRSPASRRPLSESFAGILRRGGMATPTPDLPPPGIWSGLPLIPCPECGGAVEEYIPGLGGSVTGIPSSFSHRNETGVPGGGGCSFFKTQEEYEAILRDRGLLGPAATPEQGSGFFDSVRNPRMVAAMEDLKHDMVAQKLAIAQLKKDIEDFMGKLGAGDKVQKVAKTDSLARCAKASMKWLFVANALVLLFGIVVAMSAK